MGAQKDEVTGGTGKANAPFVQRRSSCWLGFSVRIFRFREGFGLPAGSQSAPGVIRAIQIRVFQLTELLETNQFITRDDVRMS